MTILEYKIIGGGSFPSRREESTGLNACPSVRLLMIGGLRRFKGGDSRGC